MTARLALDASAGGASVALVRDGGVLGEATLPRHGSAEALAPAVATLLADAALPVSALEAIVVGGGPGSFTGLRVAAALAFGLAHGSGVRVEVVPSLALIVAAAARPPGGYVAVLDALRGEWFAQRVDVGADGTVTCVGARTLEARAAVEGWAVQEGRTLLGPPVDAAALPHARGIVRTASVPVPEGWEPDYGRLAEAQVQWEAAHGRPLPAA
ncbi:MAG: tRNA (adenosine(37)-N6)-threonylcarbamoyltransferase complex dimerization subunit type 1 TsaB [Gemmatimonadaceae bacterium]|jgi:tRNA threonylcarbamoyladenosine biosynthesis protein TsaB|nr:tRNA (adenosine(37)-N6)-threonylcarbamoyltransferase complex dimerization subunit type 1 TsaB [Gemmatimonadaceae bacterium]